MLPMFKYAKMDFTLKSTCFKNVKTTCFAPWENT